ncbi:hypothetical protein AB834_01265 [PVC group bacterium (ex Bugula neritina AB1)]|nr:hypothetical protein AB834_01265 [PVC group bacterium (ex Bugula neritina AB1)]
MVKINEILLNDLILKQISYRLIVNEITLSVRHYQKGFKDQMMIFKLKEEWAFDRYNRLRFSFKRLKGQRRYTKV